MAVPSSVNMKFTDTEKKILRMCQGNIPASLTPFKEIAAACGTTEENVLQLLQNLIDCHAIRRFGASLYHQKAGWKVNAMVAWEATEAEAEAMAPLGRDNPRISHIYFRPSPYPAWPYTFYTMIHGQTREEVFDTVNALAKAWKIPYQILQSRRELKKTSPVYF